MRSRRGDIRTARKSEPSSTVSSERVPKKRISGRSTVKRTVKSAKPIVRLEKSTRRVNVSAKVGRLVKRNRKPKKHKVEKRAELITSSGPESHSAEVAHATHETPSVVENKRRRTDTAEYIKKRFLYDVDDETKRSKHRKPRANRVIPVNPPTPRRPRFQSKRNWYDAPSEDGPLHLRSRRGRRVKPKHDYSPLPHESESSPPYSSQQDTSIGRVRRRKGRRGRRPQTSQEAELHQRRSTWELPDLFNADDNDQIDDFSQPDSVVPDAHKQRFPDTDLPNYSDVLLDGIPNRTAILGAFEEHDRRRRVLREQLRRSDQRKIRHRHLASPNVVQKGTNSFHQRALLSPGHSSDIDVHQTDIITFCADPSTEQFRRRQEFDEFEDHAEEEYLQSSGSRAPSEEPTQTPHEDLEEEELLAPELSILAGQAGNDTALSGPTSTCGGSRRKSPVRPMQVLRTKSNTSANVSSQTPMLVSNSDDSQFIFPPTVATASGYNRQIPGSGDDYLPSIFQSSGLEKSPSEASIGEAHFGLKAASVLRLPSSSNAGASAIAIRSLPEHTLQIPVSTECSNSSSSVLPSLLSQNSSRTASIAPRSFSSASPATRPSSTGSGKSLLSHSTSSASRRRPTILKRGAGSTSPAVIGSVFGAQRLTEVDDTVVNIPVSRTIGAFTPAHALKSTTAVQVVPATTSSNQPSTAPAKLLQLVTTPSISSPQLATNLTASDRLFGRRPGGSTVLSAASIAIPTGGATYVDVSEAHGNSAHPVNTPYRYAVLRGSADGKRYLVLGNQGLFERNNHTTMNSTAVANVSDESSAENAEAIEALQSHGNSTLEASLSPVLDAALNDGEDCTTEATDCIHSSHTPTLRTHLQPSFTFSTSIPAPNTPSVAAI